MITFLLTMSALMVISSLYVLIPLIPELSTIFYSSSHITVLVNSVFSLFYAVGFLFFGPLAEKCGKKTVITWGLLLLAIITLVAGFSKSIEFLIVCRVLQGFVAASFAPAAFAYIFQYFAGEQRMAAMTWITTGFLAAGIIGQIISSVIVQIFSWKYIFWIFALIYVFLAVSNRHFLISDRMEKGENHENISNVIKRLFQKKSLIKAYIIAFSLLLSYVAVYSSIGIFLSNVLKFNSHEIFNMRAIGIIGISGSLLVRPLTRNFNLSKSVAVGIGIMIISILFPMIIAVKGVIMLSLVSFVVGISVTIPCLITLVGQVAGRDSSIAVTGYTFIVFVGASIGPMIANLGGFKLITAVLVSILCIMLGIALSIEKIDYNK